MLRLTARLIFFKGEKMNENIFIDESGSFALDAGVSDNFLIDCIAGIKMDDSTLKKWEENCSKFNFSKKDLPAADAEQVIDYLAEIGAKGYIVLTDKRLQPEEILKKHKKDYVDSVNASLPNTVRAYHLSKKNEVPYSKNLLAMKLIENIFRSLMQSRPTEIVSELYWYCDDKIFCESRGDFGKDKGLLYHHLSLHSESDPIKISDISKFPNIFDESGKSISFNKVFSNFISGSDDKHFGIKAADRVAHVMREIFRGKLVLNSTESLIKLFSMPFGYEGLHFNKNFPYLDGYLSEYGASILNKIEDAVKNP